MGVPSSPRLQEQNSFSFSETSDLRNRCFFAAAALALDRVLIVVR